MSNGGNRARQAAMEFSVRLLQSTYDTANTLISPVSLMAVLVMAQMGAMGNTRAEMEKTIGMTATDVITLLNHLFAGETEEQDCGIWSRLVGDSPKAKVKFANAIWLNDNGRVRFRGSYLQKCKNTIYADSVKAPFDESFCDAVNRWAAENTDGEIQHVLESAPEDMVMLLVNALFFDAKWLEACQPTDVKQRVFTTAAGKEQFADFMEGEERRYLIDDEARGFIKNYMGGRYAFAALLPDRGVPLQEYIAGLTGEKLLSILDNPLNHKVKTRMPKFETERKLDLRTPLIRMGMHDAFDAGAADFSGIGTPVDPQDNICIGDTWQFNKIQVNESGTRAVSLTGMETMCLYSVIELEPYHVYLDRPFLYMIIDRETNLPLFVGTVDYL